MVQKMFLGSSEAIISILRWRRKICEVGMIKLMALNCVEAANGGARLKRCGVGR
jgi:hypothetical protein